MAPSAYTNTQIDRYLEYIQIPAPYQRAANPPLDLSFLTILHTHQISAIPYENLALHYSRDHGVDLAPQALYTKLTRNGRGGYCMENSIFFNHVLRALGFDTYTAGVRIRYRVDGVPQGPYGGWVHIVNIVTLHPSGAKYVVDVGFGGDGPTRPLPLVHGAVTPNLGTQEVRLIHDHIPEQTHPALASKLWIYQYRNKAEQSWNSFYAFPELEFLEQDFAIMNYFTSTHPSSFQTSTVLVVRFLRGGEEGAGTITGKVMLVNGTVKRNNGGRTSVVKVCKTEAERIVALQDDFGILLTQEEVTGIRGRCTDLDNGQLE